MRVVAVLRVTAVAPASVMMGVVRVLLVRRMSAVGRVVRGWRG